MAGETKSTAYSTLTMTFLQEGFRSLFRFTPMRLILSIVAALAAFIIHWFFLVIINNGFYMDDGNWYNGILIFSEWGYSDFWEVTRLLSALMALPLVLYALLTPLSRFVQVGFGKTVAGWFREIPRALGYATGRYGSARAIRYFFGIALGVGLSLLFQNPIFGIAMAVILFCTASYGMTAFGVMLLYCVRSDMTPVGRRKERVFVADNPCAVMDGMALGWLVSSIPFFFIKRGPSGVWILLAVFLAPLLAWGVIHLLRNRNRGAEKVLLFLFAYLFATLLLRVMADDGGWTEAGGNFLDWLFSPGASLASLLGLGPSAASFLAIAVGFIPIVGTVVDIIGAATGRDIITGEKLSASDRFLNLVGLGLPFVDSRLGDLFGKGKTAASIGSAVDGLGGSDASPGATGPSGGDGYGGSSDSSSGGYGGLSGGQGGYGGDSGTPGGYGGDSGTPGGIGTPGKKPGSTGTPFTEEEEGFLPEDRDPLHP